MAQCVKNPPAMQETHGRQESCPWVRRILWRREWQSTLVSWPGEFRGQRSLEGYSPWDHKESDMTEVTEHARM